MNEHDDDVEPEVEEGVEYEREDFPIVTEDEETEVEDPTQKTVDIDPDKSEI